MVKAAKVGKVVNILKVDDRGRKVGRSQTGVTVTVVLLRILHYNTRSTMNGLGNLYIVHISYNVCYQCNIIIGMSILTCYTDKQQPTTSNTLNTLRTMTSFLDWPRRFPVYMRLLTSAGVLPPPTTETPSPGRRDKRVGRRGAEEFFTSVKGPLIKL